MIIKTKFKCKSNCKTSPRMGTSATFSDKFIEGKYYDVEYETWSFDDGYRLNNGWKSYLVVDENGLKEKMSRVTFRAIFYTEIDDIRNETINDILK